MTPEQRRTFAALADVLVPAAHGMPAASDMGLADAPLDRVLRARADLAGPLRALLDEVAGQDPERVVVGADPARLELLLLVAGGAYTTEPRVKALLGYPGQQARTLPRAGFGAEDLAMAMMDQPPRWRAAP